MAKLKNILYFPIASYFRFFAGFRLRRWHPKIIVITGSNGKTTLFNLIKSQIGDRAKYSDHANSSFGIPFDILDLHRQSLFKSEWFLLILLAPFCALRSAPEKEYYVVEADCDRPGEGEFLGSFLKPDIVLWLNTARTHGMYFDRLIGQNKFGTVEEAIAFEFGTFLKYCKEYAVLNGDQELILRQRDRSKIKIDLVEKKKSLQGYKVLATKTSYKINNINYSFSLLFPQEVFYSIEACRILTEHLKLPFDKSFNNFKVPPGRSSIFKGIKNTTIVDSCYNANLSSMTAILNMYRKMSNNPKWGVLGDMLEQGSGERIEHEKLAEVILGHKFDRIILMGPRVSEYTYPLLMNKIGKTTILEKFINPREVLDYLLENIRGGETILFKGARFMEGIIENLLADKNDVKKLSRRETVWEVRRKQWGLKLN